MRPRLRPTQKRDWLLLPGLMVLSIFAEEMATDIFLPCLPLMATSFGVSEAKAQLTISLYLLGLSIARPFYGILSDSVGRRPVLLGGMGLFFFSSFICYEAPSFSWLLGARLTQGWGAGVAIVIGFAAVKDIFDEKKCARILSSMGIAIALAPALAPILGGHLSKHYGWPSTFLFMVGLSGVTLALIFFFMPETLERKKHVPLSIGNALRRYGRVLSHGPFMLYTTFQGLAVGALWVWLAGAPRFFIEDLKVPLETYGYYSALGVGFYILGTLANLQFIKKFTLNQALWTGLMIALSSIVLLLLGWLLRLEDPLWVQSLNCPFAFALAFLLPNSTTGALESIEESRGIGASILGTLQMILGSLGSFGVGYYADGTLKPLACLMGVLLMVALCCLMTLQFFPFKKSH